MKKIVLTLIAAMVFAWQGQSFAASSVDALIQKLEDKGILTTSEANQIKDEVSSDEQTSQQATFKSLLPDWLNGFKISGDFRFRDQLQVRKVPGGSSTQAHNNFEQNRARIRARLNFEDQLNDKLKVVIGIATDGGTARSNNYTLGGSTSANKDGVTFEDTFGKPEVILNKAYAVYTPASWLTLEGGKMDNPVWEPGGASFFWDPDITPEGGAIQLQKKVNDYITPWAQGIIFDLHDQTPTASSAPSTVGLKTDPYMFITQAGLKGNLTDKVYYKGGVSWYNVNNPDHFIFGNSLGINSSVTGTDGSIYAYNFSNIWVESGELGINDPFGELLPSPIYIPQVGIFGDYAENYAQGDKQNKAWEAGAYIGNSAVSGWGTWRLQSYFKVLERDSWLDVFPDDDFYSGDTNTEGWRSQLDIGLAKNVWFTVSYFHTNIFKKIPGIQGVTASNTNSSEGAPEDLFQWDLNMKF